LSSAGLRIVVQPAARAAASFRVIIASGKFHGAMSKHGPTGCGTVTRREAPSGLNRYSPLIRTACSLNQRRKSAA